MLNYCQDCSTAFAVGLESCPHCGSTNYGDTPMPKNTRSGGASSKYDDAGESEAEAEAPAPAKKTAKKATKKAAKKAG